MHFVKTIAILIARIFADRMIDGFVAVAPVRQAAVDSIFIGIDQRIWCNGLYNQRRCSMLGLRLAGPAAPRTTPRALAAASAAFVLALI